nr:M48 family metallopeptidase [Sphingomonas sp. CROZ-RG-20F-R02-07]
MIAALGLDRGPAVIALVPESPAAVAGLRTGDVLLAIDDVALPRDMDVSTAFDAARAHTRADAIADLLAQAAVRPFALTILRDGSTRTLRLAPLSACPARVDLARSGQRNAYADGRHVFLTTGLVAKVRSDDELAFIVAHEMAHNILGHATVMRGDTVKHGLGRTLGHSGQVVRGVERAADALGGELMLDAGYDPVVGARILERLDGTDLGIGLFATHDPARERIAAMRAIAAARHAP